MEKIEKILEINHPSFKELKNYFESLDFNSIDQPINSSNNFVYHDGISRLDKEVIINVEDTIIKNLNNQKIVDLIKDSIQYVKENFQVKMMWLMTYPPKTFLNFHRDHGKNRHLISFNQNERFFSYEAYSNSIMGADTETIINKKLNDLKDNIDQFNQYFLEYDESCRITNLESNCVYIFGNTIHNFINDSNQLRVNLVFEV